MNALFDSNIIIDYLNGELKAADELSLYNKKFISIITWIEVLVGVPDDKRCAVEAYLSGFEIVAIDQTISYVAIEIRQKEKLKLPDALILATARTLSAVLVTRNTKDFDPSQPFIREPYKLYDNESPAIYR